MMKYCLNWNGAIDCEHPHCKRVHACVACDGKHPSLDCPNFLEKLLVTPALFILILNLFVQKGNKEITES